ncbi:MAG: prepilin-type N-terminal cleavage/methylation domain-containing protein [Planctomycetaceae bacterium]|nr:prepilin-type N-terminal cleavage/methylation domain-containing protein [Planctomycetaceae bacterium]
MRNRKRNRRQAFTLMEILLVAAILVILASLSTVAFRTIGSQTTATLTRTEIEGFDQASEAFAMRYMRLPSNLDELFVGVNGEKPIMNKGDKIDPWGVEYKFSVDTERDMVIIQSAGPDMSFNTADDVTNDPNAAQNRPNN